MKYVYPDWADDLSVGDLLSNGRTTRTVRYVSRRGTRLSYVGLSIIRCSWTKRCYTIYHVRDVVYMGYSKIPGRARLDRPIDRKISRAITCRDGAEGRSLTCCDVEGVR